MGVTTTIHVLPCSLMHIKAHDHLTIEAGAPLTQSFAPA